MTAAPTINVLGDARTVHDLPIMDCRWTCVRKHMLIEAIGRGLIAEDDARLRYALSGDELESWKRRYRRSGLGGLKVKALKDRRWA